MDEIKPGRYRHFKGNEYEVLGMATHSETFEPMVIYRALYGTHNLWVRPASMWNDVCASIRRCRSATLKRASFGSVVAETPRAFLSPRQTRSKGST